MAAFPCWDASNPPSLLAPNNTIEYGLVPLGAIGVTIAVASLAWTTLDALSLAILGFFAGVFILPLSALTQHRPDPGRRGAIIGATNLLSFLTVFLGAALYYTLAIVAHVGPRGVFVIAGFLALAATIYALILLPEGDVVCIFAEGQITRVGHLLPFRPISFST